MSSRFFHTGDSESSTSDEDEEDLYSDQEEQPEEDSDDENEDGEGSDKDEDESSSDDEKKGASRFLRAGDSDSDDSDDEEREKVVKSAKDKRFDELEKTIDLIKNAEKINDWVVISAGKMKFKLWQGMANNFRIRQDEQTSGQDTHRRQCSKDLHQDNRRP